MCDTIPENGYIFRIGKHEASIRHSIASMFTQTQLTDCVLMCAQTNQLISNSSNTYINITDKVIDISLNDDSVTDNSDTVSDCASNDNTNHCSDSDNNGSPHRQLTNAHISRHIDTHRVILSAHSAFFRSIFTATNAGRMSNTGIETVVVNDVAFEDLEAIVEFIYKGEVSVAQSRIHKFLCAAQMLSVKGLMNIKLVSSDNTPIERTSAQCIEISRLKREKRALEQELRAMRETEQQNMGCYELECEHHINNKFDRNKVNCDRESVETSGKQVSDNKQTSVTLKPLSLDFPSSPHSERIESRKRMRSVGSDDKADNHSESRRKTCKIGEHQNGQRFDRSSTGISSNHSYQCPHCPQVYPQNVLMQDHINGVHLNMGQTYRCELCGRAYSWRISLNKHIKDFHSTYAKRLEL